MTPSAWLYAFLKQYERFRPTAYLPTPRDVPTIGYGHTRGVKMGDTCTMAQAEEWLAQDVVGASMAVNAYVTKPLTQNEYDALVSLTFNIGTGAFGTSTLLRKLNAGDMAGAALEFPKWDRQAGATLPGLLARREAEKAHFLTP